MPRNACVNDEMALSKNPFTHGARKRDFHLTGQLRIYAVTVRKVYPNPSLVKLERKMAIDCAFIATVIKGAERRVGKSGKPYVWMLARVGHGDDAEAVSVMVFGSAVDDMENVGPGDKVYCEGVIGLNEWEKNGQKHHGLSVMSWRCGPQKIGRKKERKPKKDTAVHNTHAPLQPDFDDPDAWRVGLDSERRYA